MSKVQTVFEKLAVAEVRAYMLSSLGRAFDYESKGSGFDSRSNAERHQTLMRLATAFLFVL